MRAMIFAAGIGSRLKPLTDKIPKALIPVMGKPMLEHTILKLKDAGFYNIVINVHHHSQAIIDYIKANDDFGIEISISDESDYLLDTGGGIKKAKEFLDDNEPFLVHNVDIFSNVNLKDIYKKHIESDSLASLLVSARETSRYLLFDDENKLCGWCNRATGEIKSHYPQFDPSRYNQLAFSGIHVISPSIFQYLDDWTGRFSIIDFYLSICAKTNIQAYIKKDLKLLDVGKHDTLESAEDWIKKNISESQD